MHSQERKQRIGCRVESCRFNEQSTQCGLPSIEVRSCHGCAGATSEDTQCASFEPRHK